MNYWNDKTIEVIGYASELLGYEFNDFLALRKDGVFYWADDAGCSCWSPFADTEFPDDFQSSKNPHDVIKALDEWGSGLHIEDDSLRIKLMAA